MIGRQHSATASIDTSRTLTIEGSPLKMFAVAALGALLTLLGIAVAVPLFPGMENSYVHIVVGWFAAVFFGAGTLLTLWRAVTTNGPVVTLSPAGICDQRLAPQEIPWPAIRSISPWIQQRQRFMVLKVDPEVEAKLELTPIARMTFEANRALGAGGLCVGSQGLKIDHEELLAIAEAYHRAHGEL